ncbi:MAG: bifunctional folylpolyglutamate synthase/dihydrofolate synthase [Bacteroidales bacterium]|nr:bifunctional folylpolyglutamate synthase/dihydrofolate synthase [Bacteroidales bacterium]
MTEYQQLLDEIFRRFPSVQNVPFGEAYKPGLDNMRSFDEAMGYPSRALRSVHVAGTNGKGSVANMLASAFSACGYKVGLYTSPHILDFRERMRIGGEMVPREWVYDFLCRWKPYFEEHNLSFFEITTGMAFKWFAESKVDVAVVEVGLGGRLDSTNIITPELSIVTTIGLDHCALLGNTLAEIAAEKAGIFKRGVPALVGEWNAETRPVFEAKAQGLCDVYGPSSDAKTFLASRIKTFSPEKKVEKVLSDSAIEKFCPPLVISSEVEKSQILSQMDLQAEPQRENLRTVLAAIELLKAKFPALENNERVVDGIVHTAARMHFHGRWELLRESPPVIADIGHNAQALQSNFRKLEAMGHPIIIYGIMADKDLDAIIPLMPRHASWIFTTPNTARALPAEAIAERCQMPDSIVIPSVKDAVRHALVLAGENRPVYIGGSTFVVAEALPCFSARYLNT